MLRKIKKREENPFERRMVAKEWINLVENTKHEGKRKKDIYPRLLTWSRSLKHKTIIEIGAGQGVCSSKIAFRQNQYIGIEPSKWLLVRARKLYKRTNRKFLLGSAYRLPLGAGSADAAFGVNVWFHLKDLKKACSELRRVLKPQGKFYIITANPDTYKAWESFFIGYSGRNARYIECPTRHKKRVKVLVGKFNHRVNPISRTIFYFHSLNDIIGSLKKNSLIITNIETFGFNKKDKTQGLFIGIQGYAS